MKSYKIFNCIFLLFVCVISPSFSQREVWDLDGKVWDLPEDTKIGIDQAIPISWVSFIQISTDANTKGTSTSVVIDLRDPRHIRFCAGWLIDQDILDNGYTLRLTHDLSNKDFFYFYDLFTSVFEESVRNNQLLINTGVKTRDWTPFDQCLSTFTSVQLLFFAEESKYKSNNNGRTYHRDDTLVKMNYWFPRNFWKNRFEKREKEPVSIPTFYYD